MRSHQFGSSEKSRESNTALYIIFAAIGLVAGILIVYKLFIAPSTPGADDTLEKYYGNDGGVREDMMDVDREELLEKLRSGPMSFREQLKRPLRGQKDFMSKLSADAQREVEKHLDTESQREKSKMNMNALLGKDRKLTDILEKKKKLFNEFGEGPIFRNGLNGNEQPRGEQKLSPQEIIAAQKNLS